MPKYLPVSIDELDELRKWATNTGHIGLSCVRAPKSVDTLMGVPLVLEEGVVRQCRTR